MDQLEAGHLQAVDLQALLIVGRVEAGHTRVADHQVQLVVGQLGADHIRVVDHQVQLAVDQLGVDQQVQLAVLIPGVYVQDQKVLHIVPRVGVITVQEEAVLLVLPMEVQVLQGHNPDHHMEALVDQNQVRVDSISF